MLFTPWRFIAHWNCKMCGLCCKAYSVVLSVPEWLCMVRNYGFETTASGLDKIFIKRQGNGSCTFLCEFDGIHLCGIQSNKPQTCKIWPSKISSEPKFGYEKEAVYTYEGNRFYVYVDSVCTGLTYGRPSFNFVNYTLREFVEVALGIRRNQSKTTGQVGILSG
jgi:Fe-S-cluster containining protein